jgi:predicted nucleotidyltransferase
MDMEDELASIVGREVDLVTRYSIETSENPYLKREILGRTESILAVDAYSYSAV